MFRDRHITWNPVSRQPKVEDPDSGQGGSHFLAKQPNLYAKEVEKSSLNEVNLEAGGWTLHE